MSSWTYWNETPNTVLTVSVKGALLGMRHGIEAMLEAVVIGGEHGVPAAKDTRCHHQDRDGAAQPMTLWGLSTGLAAPALCLASDKSSFITGGASGRPRLCLWLDRASSSRRPARSSGIGTGVGAEGKDALMIGKAYGMPPQPPVGENTHWFVAGVLAIGVEYRTVNPASLQRPPGEASSRLSSSRGGRREGSPTRASRSMSLTPRTGTSTSVSTCSTPSRTTTMYTRHHRAPRQ